MSKKNSELFKDIIENDKTNYLDKIEKLLVAIEGGNTEITKLLFGTDNLDLYSNHGSYVYGVSKNHNHCDGFDSETFTEKRLCKCMYYKNISEEKCIYKKCDKCRFKEKYGIIGDYKIVDYEVPSYYYGNGIGEIDLIISDDKDVYATEVKPYKGNIESLLRMIAEIMTYTDGYPKGKFKKAIAFFEENLDNGEKTAQQKEYEKDESKIKDLLKKADITVFKFLKVDEKVCELCKL